MFSLFEQTAKKFSGKNAIIYFNGKSSYTFKYCELYQACLRVYELLYEYLFEKEFYERRIIGILFSEQNPVLIALLFGILKFKSAFIFLSHQDLSKISEENIFNSVINIKYILLEKKSDTHSTFPRGIKILSEINIFQSQILLCEILNTFHPHIFDQDAAKSPIIYAIQTSGTTHHRKIVQVTEDCILSNVTDFLELFNLKESDVLFLSAPLTFDPSMIDIFISLTSGAALIITTDIIKSSPLFLLDVLFPRDPSSDVLKGHRVTVLEMTPSLLQRWSAHDIRTRILSDDSSLKILAIGGEECISFDKLKEYKSEKNKTEVFNLYGLTEISCWASFHKINFETGNYYKNKIPIGQPLRDIYFLVNEEDEKENCLIDGIKIGELIIGTKSRFCFVDNEKACRSERNTGDFVMVVNEEIYFLGRKDRTIKFYGIKVRLEEIENKLKSLEEVNQCHCLHDSEVNNLFVLFSLKAGSHQNDAAKVKTYFYQTFSKSIPPFYQLVQVHEFSVTNNGKLCEKALRESLQFVKKKLTEAHPVKQSLEKFMDLWFAIGLKEQGGFKDLGGNSLAAVEMISVLGNQSSDKDRFKLLNLLLSNCSFIEALKFLKKNLSKKKSKLSRIKTKTFFKHKYSSLILAQQKHSFMKSYFFLKLRRSQTSNKFYLKPIYWKSTSIKRNFKRRKKRILSTDSSKHPKSKRNLKVTIARGENFNAKYLSDLKNFNVGKDNGLKICTVWRADLKSCVDTSPVILHSKSQQCSVIISSHHGLFTHLKATSGEIIISRNLKTDIVSSACVGPESSNSGYFSYLGCYNGYFYKINNFSGKIIWRFKSKSLIKSRPVLVANHVYFASYDLHLYCLNERTGALIWKIFIGYKGIHANILLLSQLGFICVPTLSGHVYGINIVKKKIEWVEEMSDPIFSSPCSLRNSNDVIVATVKGHCCCFNAKNGYKIWTLQLENSIYADLVGGVCDQIDDVFVCNSQCGSVFCFKVCDNVPVQLWKIDLAGQFSSSPFIFPLSYKPSVNQHILAVVTVNTEGTVTIMSLDDGKILGSTKLPSEVFSSPIVYFDKIFVGCRDNFLYCLRIEPR